MSTETKPSFSTERSFRFSTRLPHATPENRPHAENIRKAANPMVQHTTAQNPQEKPSEEAGPFGLLTSRAFFLSSNVFTNIPPDLKTDATTLAGSTGSQYRLL